MKIFIDEYGKIFCEFKNGVYSPISKQYFESIKKYNLIKNIEFVRGQKNGQI